MAVSQEVTVLLKEINDGDRNASDKLLPLIYDELRKLARAYLRNERSDHTLQATALVHEAYIRLVEWENVSWQNRAHFFAVAAQIMRRLLVDYAREKKAQKRDGGQKLVLDETVSFTAPRGIDLLVLDEALENLAKLDKMQAKVVELRFFGGLTIEETAHTLNVSPTTVKREWTAAKAWLYKTITGTK
ncbi:MAG: sigma-70 family RNA polymerase sigma factor [Pyrinomonadaceae bacterium]